MHEMSETSENRDIVERQDVSGKQELQLNQDALENKIFYGEHHIRYLQDEIDREHSYRRRVSREKKENQKNFLKYGTVLTYIIPVVIGILIFTNGFDTSVTVGFVGAFRGISIAILLPVFIFAIIGLIFFGRKAIHYGKQLKGSEDPRLRGGYKSYDEMDQISEVRMKYLEKELMESVLTQEANKELLTERRREEAQKETEVISMDELLQIKGEEIPALPEPEINMKTISMDELYQVKKKSKKAIPEKKED